ncbi:DsrE family protein [Varunaivibrio sulfuroxidans]|uniref:tRNA 2-thiouridine synthesizing protein C n=1 Tax=Varunaivibrio sulfuroxidans TaxID=1773489 RepID=A0A4R3J784_9PROT|nr:DsrE family protein [Varunaivibrio sulfuroxidans]TCS60320.1 tRNA 2-thiouridine synthesizing protein C [Varunaivibrio sulfuroxidans]WES30993.1 DsrE family protein [Varunaivibrio sulfuroxidans]
MAEYVFETEGVKKTFTFLNRKAPYGTIYALEVLETVLISAAFEQHANIVFVDDGVYQIKKDQDTAAINMKNFSPTYGIIEMEKEDADEDEDMDMVWRIIVEKESMEARGLSPDDFKVEVEVLSSAELADVLEQSDVVIGG